MGIDTVFMIAPPYAFTEKSFNILFLFLNLLINLNLVLVFCLNKTVLKDDSSHQRKQKVNQKYLHTAPFVTV